MLLALHDSEKMFLIKMLLKHLKKEPEQSAQGIILMKKKERRYCIIVIVWLNREDSSVLIVPIWSLTAQTTARPFTWVTAHQTTAFHMSL